MDRLVRRGLYLLFAAGLLAMILVVPGSRVAATQTAAPDYSQTFNKTDVMIPMRDGVRLHTEIYAPKDAKEALPLLIERTPYGLERRREGIFAIDFHLPRDDS